MSDASVERLLVTLVSDPDELCRSAAAEALGALGYTPSLDAVAERLRDDPAPVVRASAAEALGDFGDPRVRGALEAALEDPDFAVRAYAAASLGLCCGAEVLPVLGARFATETSPDVRAEIVGARHRLGAPGALAELVALVDGADDDLGTRVLNVVEDLVARRPPPSLAADAGVLHGALSRLAGRAPMQQGHARRIAGALAEAVDRPKLAELVHPSP
jgi:HEAT repeat protein